MRGAIFDKLISRAWMVGLSIRDRMSQGVGVFAVFVWFPGKGEK